jgi:hypothetical protein
MKKKTSYVIQRLFFFFVNSGIAVWWYVHTKKRNAGAKSSRRRAGLLARWWLILCRLFHSLLCMVELFQLIVGILTQIYLGIGNISSFINSLSFWNSKGKYICFFVFETLFLPFYCINFCFLYFETILLRCIQI